MLVHAYEDFVASYGSTAAVLFGSSRREMAVWSVGLRNTFEDSLDDFGECKIWRRKRLCADPWVIEPQSSAWK